ncbi:GumC family protein [Oryzibacter oryziterrae]|uniref:GumC family protein n=1 Tax=Oryzibacter oryziterrae TaxID=2766474 RepID=UPI001F3D1291|nr:exopolysaccharide transport family protein [Oryzibacter oryziterrae]
MSADHAHPDDDIALDLKGILAALWRRRLRIVAVTGLTAVVAFVGLSLIPPSFQAETKILIERREVGITQSSQPDATDQTLLDQESVASQVQLLTSRDLARRVAARFHLQDSSEFNGALTNPLIRVAVMLGINADPSRASPEERMIDTFMEHLEVFRVDGSRVITVHFTARDRGLAADVANAIVAEYMTLQGEAKRSAGADQTKWLGEEVTRLQAKVQDAEAAVEKYRSGSDLIVGENNASPTRQQISDLTNAMAAARNDQASAQSKAQLLAGVLKSGSSLDAASDVLTSDTFRSLRSREIALRSRLSELSVTLLPAHPQVKAVESQIGDIMSQEKAEAGRILASLTNDAKVAGSRITALTTSLDQLKAASSADGESEVQLRALERDAASQRGLLEDLMARYRTALARQNADATPADARVIASAMVPAEPVFPRVIPMGIVATLAAFLLSVAWVITAEFTSGRALVPLRKPHYDAEDEPAASVEPLPQSADLPKPQPEPIAIIAPPAPTNDETLDPRVRRFRARVGSLTAAATDPARAASYPDFLSVAGLHGLLLSEGRVRVAVVGFSDLTAGRRTIDALSRRAAGEGAHVVVIETDTVEGHAALPGLSDLLMGDADFAEIIRRNPVTRAHEIAAGLSPLDEALSDRDGVGTMLDALARTYDLVLLDLGPMRSDAVITTFIALADHVVLVGDEQDTEIATARDILLKHGLADVSIAVPPESTSVGAVA